MKIFLLSTCDAWKSSASMQPYFLVNSRKTGIKRLLNVIREGIQKGLFVYESDELEKSEQIACLENDARQDATALCYDLQTKLEYGSLQLVEDGSYF
uniref:hypothetical protein n=1 Tax=Alloprevotella sp. TaxID=1872471 RepID=UPI003FF0024C